MKRAATRIEPSRTLLQALGEMQKLLRAFAWAVFQGYVFGGAPS